MIGEYIRISLRNLTKRTLNHGHFPWTASTAIMCKIFHRVKEPDKKLFDYDMFLTTQASRRYVRTYKGQNPDRKNTRYRFYHNSDQHQTHSSGRYYPEEQCLAQIKQASYFASLFPAGTQVVIPGLFAFQGLCQTGNQ